MPLYPRNYFMFPVTNRFDERLGYCCIVLPVTTVLRPLLHEIPVVAKKRIPLCLFQTFPLQISNSDQVPQIVRMTRVHGPLVWKFVTPGSPCDARLQAAFNCIAGKVIRAVRMAGAQ